MFFINIIAYSYKRICFRWNVITIPKKAKQLVACFEKSFGKLGEHFTVYPH